MTYLILALLWAVLWVVSVCAGGNEANEHFYVVMGMLNMVLYYVSSLYASLKPSATD